MKESELRSCALAAQEILAGLVADAEERERVGRKLADALALPPGTAAIALRGALTSHEATRRFLQAKANAAAETMTPDEDRAIGMLGVPGIGGRIGTYFVCPEGDYDEVRETLADGTPVCPVHGRVMTRKDG
jgi:hypothetical protein